MSVTLNFPDLLSQSTYNVKTYGLEKRKTMVTEFDILALSCVWWRMREEKHPRIIHVHDFSSKELVDQLTTTDLEIARNIREYYSKKIMLWKLSGMLLTKFRTDLASFLTTDGRETHNDFQGMVYRLPEFYHYDCELDELVEKELDVTVPLRNSSESKTLLPLKALVKKHRGRTAVMFFFKDLKTNSGVVSGIEKNNKLLHVWEILFNLKQPMVIKGNYRPSERGFKHYSLDNWKLVNTLSIMKE